MLNQQWVTPNPPNTHIKPNSSSVEYIYIYKQKRMKEPCTTATSIPRGSFCFELVGANTMVSISIHRQMPQADLQPQWLHYCHRIAGIATSGYPFWTITRPPPAIVAQGQSKASLSVKSMWFHENTLQCHSLKPYFFPERLKHVPFLS